MQCAACAGYYAGKRMAEMQKHLDKVTWKLDFFSEKLRIYEESRSGR